LRLDSNQSVPVSTGVRSNEESQVSEQGMP
jgi:hypothetical protein